MKYEAREWFSLGEIARALLPGMPKGKRGMQRLALSLGWSAPHQEGVLWRNRSGSGSGREYSVRLLTSTQTEMLRAHAFATAPLPASPFDLARLERALVTLQEISPGAPPAAQARLLSALYESTVSAPRTAGAAAP